MASRPIRKDFSDLSERELLALAISLEEEDARIYDEFAEGLRETFPDTAQMFNGMADEESQHRHRLLTLYRDKFGERIPLIRRQDVRGFVERQPVWLARPLGLDKVREQAAVMRDQVNWYLERARAAARVTGWRSAVWAVRTSLTGAWWHRPGRSTSTRGSMAGRLVVDTRGPKVRRRRGPSACDGPTAMGEGAPAWTSSTWN